MSKVWVELSASGSAAHGPALRLRLVSLQHPQVRGQVQNSKASDSSKAQLHHTERALATARGERHAQSMPGHGADVLAKAKQETAGTSGRDTSAEEVIGTRNKDRPGAGRHQHRHHVPAEPSSIPAVLAASHLFDDGEALSHQEAASADVKQDLAGVQEPGCRQLISHTTLPGVVQSKGPHDKEIYTLWRAQVRLGKVAAKLNATFTMSERKQRLQGKFQLASLQVAELQKGLLC